jgi:predicted transcriptional regulator
MAMFTSHYGGAMKAKPKENVLSIRLDKQLSQRLDGLAAATDRSRSFLAAEAVEAYVSVQEWQVAAIQEGLRQARAGQYADPVRIAALLKRAKAS